MVKCCKTFVHLNTRFSGRNYLIVCTINLYSFALSDFGISLLKFASLFWILWATYSGLCIILVLRGCILSIFNIVEFSASSVVKYVEVCLNFLLASVREFRRSLKPTKIEFLYTHNNNIPSFVHFNLLIWKITPLYFFEPKHSGALGENNFSNAFENSQKFWTGKFDPEERFPMSFRILKKKHFGPSRRFHIL